MNLIKFWEKIVYASGYNMNLYNTDMAIDGLKGCIPKKFLNREVADVGCGDGVNTIKIEKAVRAKEMVGYEMSSNLIKTARNKGLKIIQVSPGYEVTGDLGVLWGVVHHFDDPEEEMYRIIKNFKSFIIREPTDHWRIFEAGKRYPEKTMTKWVEEVARRCNKKMTKAIIKKANSVLYFIG